MAVLLFLCTLVLPATTEQGYHSTQQLLDIASQFESGTKLTETTGQQLHQLDETSGQQLFGKGISPQMKATMLATYRQLLLLKRFTKFASDKCTRSHYFTFQFGDNVVRAAKLGLKALAFVGGHVAGHAVEAANHGVKGAHHAGEVATEAIGAGSEVVTLTGETINEAWAHHTHPHGSPSRAMGKYTIGGGFEDVTFSLLLESWQNFSSHRKKRKDGEFTDEWDTKKIDETMKKVAKTGTCATAEWIEKQVNNKYVTWGSLLISAVGFVLLCIPEPATTALGAGLLIGTSIEGVALGVTDAFAGNIVAGDKKSNTFLMMGAFFAKEAVFVDGEKTKSCSILDGPTACGDGMACVRETAFLESFSDPKLREHGWVAAGGICAEAPPEVQDNSHPCLLHQDCKSGYCHFSAQQKDHEFNMYQTPAMWKKVNAQLKEKNAVEDDELLHILLDGGVCRQPTKYGSKEGCDDGTASFEISKKHNFGVCLPTNDATDAATTSEVTSKDDASTRCWPGFDNWPKTWGNPDNVDTNACLKLCPNDKEHMGDNAVIGRQARQLCGQIEDCYWARRSNSKPDQGKCLYKEPVYEDRTIDYKILMSKVGWNADEYNLPDDDAAKY